MKVTPYRFPRAKQAARLAIPWPQEPINYIARFDRLNNLKAGVAFIIGGTRHANL